VISCRSLVRRCVALGLLFCASLSAPALDALHVRDGWPHARERIAATGELRVAFLGGSITAADGWRSLTVARLRELLPDAKVVEIVAGLPGTGSDLGACRVGRDVLRHQPDVVFVEFAVNDASTPPAQIERTIEGIVRQVKAASPTADLCFVYTISTPGLADLLSGSGGVSEGKLLNKQFSPGRFPAAATAMERVAQHYGIPSLHFGVEVARRVASGELIFKGTATDGDRAFSLDGVHPTATGHRIYFEQLAAALPTFLNSRAAARPLPPPLHADNWERAALHELEPARFHGPWELVPIDDANLRGVTKALLPPTWRTSIPGAALDFEFTGTRFGLLGIAAPDSGEFIVTIDDLPPERATFFDAYVTPTFCRQTKWFFPRELPPGRHRVRIELGATPLDKAAIKTRAGKTLEPAAAFAPQRLTLSGLLTVDTTAK
jgi:lysophospholipase L1-like esterase